MLKDKYLKVQNWLKTKDKKVIDFIRNEKPDYHQNTISDHSRFMSTLNWYDSLSKETDFNQKIIFGEIILSINDIKNNILSSLKNGYDYLIDNDRFMSKEDEDYDEENNGYYDSSGHYNKEGYEAVIDFFEELNDSKIESIYSGSVEDDYEIDINGGRSYLMHNIAINQMIYNYLYFTKKAKYENLEYDLYNGNDIFDGISDYYQDIDIFLPTPKELSDIHSFFIDKKYQLLVDRYNSMVKNIIDNFEEEPILKEKIEIAKSMKINLDYIKSKLREEKINEILS